MKKDTLVLFDFDATLTNKDSFLEFIKYYRGNSKYFLGLFILSPLVLFFKIKIISPQLLKEIFLTYFFKGEKKNVFQQKAKDFSLNIIPSIINKKAFQKLSEHLTSNHQVIVVTASPEEWTEPWISSLKAECIATRLTYEKNIFTGKIDGKNCNGEEKVKRIKEKIKLTDYSTIIAYGNSSADVPMLNIANEKYYKSFN